MNNRRQFIKKSLMAGLLSSFAPCLMAFKEKGPESDYRSFIFDNVENCKMWGIDCNHYVFSNEKESIIASFSDKQNLLIQTGCHCTCRIYSFRNVKNFKVSFIVKRINIERFGSLTSIHDLKLEQPTIKVEFELC